MKPAKPKKPTRKDLERWSELKKPAEPTPAPCPLCDANEVVELRTKHCLKCDADFAGADEMSANKAAVLAARAKRIEPTPAQFCGDVAHDDWRRDGFPCPACTKKPAPAQGEICPACDGSGDGIDVGECVLVACMCLGTGRIGSAPAQGEREAVERFSPTTSVPYCGRASEVEAYMAEDDDGEYMTVAQHERIVAALARPAQTEQQPVLSNCLDLAEKMTVSVDVSTGDDDAFNRLFCKVAGVQEESDGSWTILAVDPKPNFAAPIAQTAPQPEHGGLVTEAMRNAAIAEYSRHDGDFSDFADSVIRAALSAGGRDE
ncbi:MAG: hypothetical protein KJ890_15585 [Gammaproteobacteria bacterium]|nr:hypothetical protein [Gammaproteobacteria bacterium]